MGTEILDSGERWLEFVIIALNGSTTVSQTRKNLINVRPANCELITPNNAIYAEQPAGNDVNLIPPLRMIMDGSISCEQFVTIGDDIFNKFLLSRVQLLPNEKLLDVGCGIGRIARPLKRYLNKYGSYDGFDVIRESIDWCKEAYKHANNFNFLHADIYNSEYNPSGQLQAKKFIFPYNDNYFDVILLTSVFTHMLPEGVRQYMAEISRVLKPGGRTLITYFLLNQESALAPKNGKPSISLPFLLSDECRVADIYKPEGAVGLDESFVREQYTEFNQEIAEIIYGFWCGRKTGKHSPADLQDAVIAVHR